MELNKFISKNITKRTVSMFENDIKSNATELNQKINNKTVLVIGGAGTIGSSFIQSLLRFKPKSLVVVDINENGLTELTRNLRSTSEIFVPDDYVTYPMSYADPIFYKMFKYRNGFDIVANFSAHKHVRSEKDKFSIEALINNNVVHAKELMDLLLKYPPKHFFCVSTDKAANPVNIMGGSKKIMEEMIMSYSHKFPVTTARFANVAFSNGSLPSGFLERISKNQPLSAPKDVTRYFVSPEESGQICLIACIIGKSGDIYFPKLKEKQTMTFSEIAVKLLEHHNFKIELCKSEKDAINKSKNILKGTYPVYFTNSDTTGEKAYEEFHTDKEQVDLSRHTALGVVINSSPKSFSEINDLFVLLKSTFEKAETTKEDILLIMKNFLVNFNHKETGKSLDSKM